MAEAKRYATLEDIHREHRSGWAVKHHRHPLFDDDVYFTWHRLREPAYECLWELDGIVADERVIKFQETDAWRLERARIKGLRRERTRSRRKGSGVRLRVV